MPRTASRLVRAAAASLAVALALTGCAATTPAEPAASTETDAAVEHADLSLQLRFIANAQFAGSYMAQENGHYDDEDLTVSMTPGGVGIAIDPLVAQGTADIGISSAANVAMARAEGADLKIIGAGYQHSATVVMSLPENPIETLAELKGRKLGAVSSNFAMVIAFLEANGIAEDEVELVSIQGDAAPLLSGQVDAMMTIATSQPLVLEAQGIEPVLIPMAENNFDELDFTYIVTERTLADPAKRAAVVRFLRAEIAGWNDALADPEAAADLAVDVYGKDNGLDRAQQVAQATAQVSLFQTDDDAPGIFWLSDAGMERTLATLDKRGIDADESLFDTSILTEVYGG
ncbi:ABC transporter substrate-binding protein [Microbacterium sp. No. 7]|uniref:ABC transporter substrate-binding protein n=1 Tax=Microbacterium sp. No. 7 TaxID=1714373 RepID=UPI0006CFEB39|nr:ABC transporter substrate-binding protein [Microbacterium sp. No. 7]